MEKDGILEEIRQADMVLVGLGEDFDSVRELEQNADYRKGREALEKEELLWLLPAWKEFCSEKCGGVKAETALGGLAGLLEGKNYFVVSVSVNSGLVRAFRKEGRIVTPCGSSQVKQCSRGCEKILRTVTLGEKERLRLVLEELWAGKPPEDAASLFGMCPECGAPLTLNNIYAENYNEDGYMEQWRLYTKWLQGTLNKRLFILELGVGMRYPSVIRWPFEKIAFLNQKAYICRVHEKLYQMDEKLSGKGCGISQNAIDWLGQLC